MRKFWFVCAALLAVALLAACVAPTTPAPAAPAAPADAAAAAPAATAFRGAGKAPEDLMFGTVVKSSAFNWFIRMEEGVRMFAEETGINAFQQGPSVADAAQQIQVTEDVIAQGVDALLVVPFQVPPMEPVMKKAMEQGIVVVSHEASDAVNVHYDVEAFDNPSYGRHMMDMMAQCMNEEGQYAAFVGSLTSTTHNEWVDAAIAHQLETFPNMEFVGTKNESGDTVERAYEITKELLKTFPELRGIQGSAATDVVGAGQAIEEAGLQDTVCVFGTSIPSYSGELMKTGAVDMSFAWDPAMAGMAMNRVAQLMLNGEAIVDGMDLQVPGYEAIRLDGNVIYGNAWIDMTAENMDQFPF